VPPKSDFSALADGISAHHDSLRVWHSSRSYDTRRGWVWLPTFVQRQEQLALPQVARFRVAHSHSGKSIHPNSKPKLAWDWVEDVVSDISALRSMASSITSTTLHRATVDWRSTVRRIRVSEIECLGLASLTSMMIYVIVWLLAWQAFVTAQLCCLTLSLSS